MAMTSAVYSPTADRACDYEADGHYVYTEVDVWFYGNQRVYDNTNAGCDIKRTNDNPAWQFKVCEDVPAAEDPCTRFFTA
jgi:hypothetical protein